MVMERHFGKKSKFIFMITGRDFIITVEIFMMTGRDFHDDRSRFYYERLKFF